MKSRLFYQFLTRLNCAVTVALTLTSPCFADYVDGGDFKLSDFLNGKAQKRVLSKTEMDSFHLFQKESAKTGKLGTQHKAGPQVLEGSDLLGVDSFTLNPTPDELAAISSFQTLFAAGRTLDALRRIQPFSISRLHLYADSKFDYRLGICLLSNKCYGQAVEYLERFAYYNNESIEGWRAMRLAIKLSGKSFNSPELELGFAKNEGVHFPLNEF